MNQVVNWSTLKQLPKIRHVRDNFDIIQDNNLFVFYAHVDEFYNAIWELGIVVDRTTGEVLKFN